MPRTRLCRAAALRHAVVGGGTFDTGNDALVANGYFTYQFTPNLWLGMSLNSPFGLSASFPNLWAGRDYAANSSKLVTYNAAPSLAYRFNDWISVGIGAQIQYAKATLNKGATAWPGPPICGLLHCTATDGLTA